MKGIGTIFMVIGILTVLTLAGAMRAGKVIRFVDNNTSCTAK